LSLLGFRYLRKQNVLILFLLVTLISTLFSITAFSLLGFYNGFNAYLGEGENIVAIYSIRGRTPFTGIVPSYLAERLNTVKGVQASSPEVLAPCIVKGEAAFARGAILEELSKLNPLTIVDGNLSTPDDLDSAIVGRNFAQKLNLKPGNQILVQGTLTERYLELHIKGIYESHTPLDDEIIIPLCAGQCLRAVDYGQVTLIRVKIDKTQVTPEAIFQEIAKEASEPSQDKGKEPAQPGGVIPWSRASFQIGDIGVKDVQTFMKSYLDQYGVTPENMLILSVTVFIFSSASLAIASTTLTRQHEHEIGILKSLGASKKTLKMDLLAKTLSISIIASACGALLAMLTLTVIWETGYLQILSHRVLIQFNPIIVVLNFALVSIVVSASILHSMVKK
jgi:ABC-type lipoprotein release transport system permease subunit